MNDLRDSILAIWDKALKAVDPLMLISNHVNASADALELCGECFTEKDVDRLVVVGAGKAGHKMGEAFEHALKDTAWFDKLSGWVNVPDNCVKELKRIRLHGARAAGINEPSERGVQGSKEMFERISTLGSRDLCVVLISGGGSALLPAPVSGITLADKLRLTQQLMRSGLTITELNTVRKRLSFLKGGGLASACTAGKLISLIISDVVGDPLSVIASGPTVPDGAGPADALEIVRRAKREKGADIPASVFAVLEAAAQDLEESSDFSRVSNHLIACNSTALDAAAAEAQSLGFRVRSLGSENEGIARAEGEALADMCSAARGDAGPLCILSGGEPIVELTPGDEIGKGGRNMELALAALMRLQSVGHKGIAVLSGGTDGEDGPTDAAGAYTTEEVLKKSVELGLDPKPYLQGHNSYVFFEQAGGLLKTGPTGTNVMDLRICLVASGSS